MHDRLSSESSEHVTSPEHKPIPSDSDAPARAKSATLRPPGRLPARPAVASPVPLPAALLEPASPEFATLLADVLEPRIALATIALANKLTILQVADWAESPPAALAIARLTALQAARVRAAAAIAATDAVAHLANLLAHDHARPETTRKAAAALLALLKPDAPPPARTPSTPPPPPPPPPQTIRTPKPRPPAGPTVPHHGSRPSPSRPSPPGPSSGVPPKGGMPVAPHRHAPPSGPGAKTPGCLRPARRWGLR